MRFEKLHPLSVNKYITNDYIVCLSVHSQANLAAASAIDLAHLAVARRGTRHPRFSRTRDCSRELVPCDAKATVQRSMQRRFRQRKIDAKPTRKAAPDCFHPRATLLTYISGSYPAPSKLFLRSLAVVVTMRPQTATDVIL